jgi:hypothetical protein
MSDPHHTEPRKLGRSPDITNGDRLAAHLPACILFSVAVFAIWPETDLRVSQAFHDQASRFVIDGDPLTKAPGEVSTPRLGVASPAEGWRHRSNLFPCQSEFLSDTHAAVVPSASSRRMSDGAPQAAGCASTSGAS